MEREPERIQGAHENPCSGVVRPCANERRVVEVHRQRPRSSLRQHRQRRVHGRPQAGDALLYVGRVKSVKIDFV